MQRLSGYIIAALMASGFFTSSLSAATLAELEAQYTKDRDAIAWKFVDRNNAVRAGYTNALITLEAGFKSKGALEGVLAVRKERESYAASVDGKLPEGQAIPEILDLRAKQKKMAADAVLEEKKAIVTTAQQYVDKLKVLEKDLTVADKIDTAVIVQTKRKQVMEQQDVVAALAALRDAGAGRAAGGDVGGKAEDPVAGDPRDGSAALFNGEENPEREGAPYMNIYVGNLAYEVTDDDLDRIAGQAEHYDRGFRMDTAFINRVAVTRGWQYQALDFYPSHPRYRWIKRINPFFWVSGAEDRTQGGTEIFYLPAVMPMVAAAVLCA